MTIAERMQAQLAPYAEADPAGLLDGLAAGFAAPLEICDVARDTDTHIAWGTVVDPDVADARLLPWLAQSSGDKLVPGETEQESRDRLKSPNNFLRGAEAAIRAEVEPTLAGTRTVTVLPRTSSAWTLTVRVRASECPDPAASERAARRQKAVGLVMTFLASDAPVIDEWTRTINGVTVGIDAIDEASDVT